MEQKNRLSRGGFTLIEILLVVAIIGILVAMVVPNLTGRSQQAKIATTKADIEANLATALDLYEIDTGTYPTTDQGLEALIREPRTSPVPEQWNGPYLKKKKVPTDAWGQDYHYESPGQNNPKSYDLMSFGADGVESEDDISNWIDENEE